MESGHTHRHPGLDPGSRYSHDFAMERERQGGWVYMMADRYRGTIYVGLTADLVFRIDQYRSGSGSDFCTRHGLNRLVWAERRQDIIDSITHEKRLKRWRRQWKFALVERGNPDRQDLFNQLL